MNRELRALGLHAVGATFTALTALAAFTIASRTPASTPWPQTLGLTALYLAGGLVSLWPPRQPRSVARAPLGAGDDARG